MRTRTTLLASALVGWIALAAPARADNAWGDVEVLADADLDTMRGGFSAGGMEIGFGAVVTTYSGGQMALQTQLTWSDSGLVVAETLGNLGEAIGSLTAAQRSELGIEGLNGGVVIADETGVTALVHNVTEGALQNVILNTASGRALTQDIDVTLQLPGFEGVQASLLLDLLGMRLHDDLHGIGFGVN